MAVERERFRQPFPAHHLEALTPTAQAVYPARVGIGAPAAAIAYSDMATSDRVLGIVLAAGRSERMGRTKALLRLGEQSFLRAAVETLSDGGCGDVIVVAASLEVETEARSAGARVVWNDAPASEQVDSLRLGLDAAADHATAALVLPVDHPLVTPATVAALIAAHIDRPHAIARPVRAGRPGHPTLFPRPLWPALQDPSLPHGARSVVEAPETETVDVPVDDDGVIADIDTPDAYARHVKGR
jgi:molybdenum cofactor cytidylyltransferase